MYCTHCGHKQEVVAKYCSSCGKAISKDNLLTTHTGSDSIKNSKASIGARRDTGMIIVGCTLIISFLFGRFLGLVGIIILFVPGALGWWLATLYSKKNEGANSFINFICWANLLTWIIPPVGAFTVGFSLSLSGIYGKTSKKYIILGLIGMAASIINAIIGVMIQKGMI